MSQPEGRLKLSLLLRVAEECLQGGGGVFVHCMQGKHRTGAFCAILLAIIHILFDPL